MSSDVPTGEPEPEGKGAESSRAAAEGGGRAADALAESEAQLAVLRDEKLRLLAEFQNYRRRSERDRLSWRQDGIADLVKAILPGLQDLSRAIEAARTDANGGALVNGLELVRRGFSDALAAVGVSEIDPIGQPFDAACMEAIGQASSEEIPDGHVLLVVQRGFQFEDRLIRPAQVLLSAGRAAPGDASPAGPSEDPS